MSDYCTSAHFTIPNDALLDCDIIKWDTIRRTYKLPLPDFFKSLLYPTSPKKPISNTNGKSDNGGITKKLTALTFNEHNVKELKKGDQKLFKEVIQKQGLLLRDI